jgi:hypothetical protein
MRATTPSRTPLDHVGSTRAAPRRLSPRLSPLVRPTLGNHQSALTAAVLLGAGGEGGLGGLARKRRRGVGGTGGRTGIGRGTAGEGVALARAGVADTGRARSAPGRGRAGRAVVAAVTVVAARTRQGRHEPAEQKAPSDPIHHYDVFLPAPGTRTAESRLYYCALDVERILARAKLKFPLQKREIVGDFGRFRKRKARALCLHLDGGNQIECALLEG